MNEEFLVNNIATWQARSGDDGRRPSSGPITRVVTRKIQED